MEAFAKLGDSRKAVFALLLLVLVFVLVLTHNATFGDFVSMAKWIGVTFLGATAAEDIAKALLAPKPAAAPPPPSEAA